MSTKSIRRGYQKGQVVVLVALALPVLLGAIALGTDTAVMYVQWVNLQKAADSAAVAGAEYLPDASFSGANGACIGYPTSAQQAACSFALLNQVTASEIQSLQVAADSKSITVTFNRTVPAFFSRALGMSSFPISVTAKAASTPVGAVGQSIPIGVQYTTPYSNGEVVILHSGGDGPGNWGGLALGCTGGACFSDNLLNNYQGQVNAGDVVSSEPGAKTGPTSSAITTRVANGASEYPSGTWNSHAFDDPRVAVVALVDWSGCNGRCQRAGRGLRKRLAHQFRRIEH